VARRAEDPEHLGRGRRRLAKLVHAAVVRDAVQPGAQAERAIVRPQARIGAHEDVLQCVLGILAGAGEHLPRVREQPRPVAVVDHAERLLLTLAEQRHELFVGAQPQQGRPDRESSPRQSGWCLEGGGFHI